MNRPLFIRGTGCTAATAALPPSPLRAAQFRSASDRLDGALVLAGGGARGAYEAGWIEALRRLHAVFRRRTAARHERRLRDVDRFQ
jgi:hypothetical protein